jgi:hypothetical protein
MRMRLGVLLAVAGATASAFVLALSSDSALDRDREALAPSTTASDGMTTRSHPQRTRVFSAKDPLLASPHLADPIPVTDPNTAQTAISPSRWAGATTIRADEPGTPRRVSALASGKNLTSLRPGDPDARAQLVRDIQYELKRVGCYNGEVHGAWNTGTKHAMKLFTDRVNATLPLEEPDYVLLTLVQNENPGTCGRRCPEGQMASEEGRCLPRAVVAQQRSGRKGAAPQDQDVAITGSHHSASAPLPLRTGIGASAATSERLEGEDASRIGGSARLESASDEIAPRSGLGAPGLDAQTGTVVGPPQQPRRTFSTKRPTLQPGSTRQVFSNIMRYAP